MDSLEPPLRIAQPFFCNAGTAAFPNCFEVALNAALIATRDLGVCIRAKSSSNLRLRVSTVGLAAWGDSLIS